MTSVSYLDSSALVKLVAKEAGSSALSSHVERVDAVTSSALARTEVLRAARRYGPEPVARARSVLAEMDLIRLSDPILDRAASIDPLEIRSLDAIHLASALSLGEPVMFVSYDRRQAHAARALGLTVASPA